MLAGARFPGEYNEKWWCGLGQKKLKPLPLSAAPVSSISVGSIYFISSKAISGNNYN